MACCDEHYQLYKRNGQLGDDLSMAVDLDTLSVPVRARVLDEQERSDIQQRSLYLENSHRGQDAKEREGRSPIASRYKYHLKFV